ncbi:YegS/Rv2252/BmrU family lipid kinase [Selenomonas sp. TAMA-11512]|uniref:diacylglycerol/lipid kinase family protein n=1 Tax=Selenomonas sp. TAMA-11512 TaxID=3095337 RepID=UPI003087E63F|nr:YegS/Rv2252/BmrU family lipid kinase [Selenomonas sp. TAMA-11512]
MKKFLLVYNPVSGTASFRSKLDAVIAKFQEYNVLLTIYRTKRDNADFLHCVELLRPDGIIISGGDGTVHEIVNRLVAAKMDIPIAIIGSGTSNDFATFLGLSSHPERCIEQIMAGRTMAIDLGRIGDTYFINVASAGVLTNIAHEVDARLKNVLGKMAYYMKGVTEIPNFKSVHFTIDVDGRILEQDGYLFVVVNSGVVGSFNNVATKAVLDDGKLDLLLIKKSNVAKLMTLTAEIVSGKGVLEKNILYLQGKKFVISADTELDSDLDGEKGPKLPLTIEAIPKAIRVFY